MYFESHHIVPKCLGGDGSKENLVLLTAREHYICHKLLVLVYPNEIKLLQALWLIIHINDIKINSREYEFLRVNVVNVLSLNMKGINNPNYGKVYSCEEKQILSKLIPKKFGVNNKFFGKKHSKEWCDKYVKSGSEHPMFGKRHSDETKLKWSQKRKGTNSVKRACKYCGKIMDELNLIHWHDENCKFKILTN